jgi:hypothetical protein
MHFNDTLLAGLHPGTKADARFQFGMKRRGALPSPESRRRKGKISDTKISLLLSYWKPRRGLLKPGLFGQYG